MELARFRTAPFPLSPFAVLPAGPPSADVAASLPKPVSCEDDWFCCDSVDSLRYFSRSDASCGGGDIAVVSKNMVTSGVEAGDGKSTKIQTTRKTHRWDVL